MKTIHKHEGFFFIIGYKQCIIVTNEHKQWHTVDITICKPKCIRYIYLFFIKLLRENLFFSAVSAKYWSSHNMIVRCLGVLQRLLNFLCRFWSYYTPSLHMYYVMWPGFDSRTRRHMWAEFVGSLLCCERFFSRYSGFPLSSKTNIWFDLFDLQSPQLVEHSCSARMIWDFDKVIIIIIIIINNNQLIL